MKRRTSIGSTLTATGLALAGFAAVFSARADDVTEWNQNMLQAGLVAKTSPLIMTRFAAIVQASVFDALNGIERRYAPVHVTPAAPKGASRRAAVVQAAYASLLKLYPAQKAALDSQLAASLAHLIEDGQDAGQSIERGLAWGQQVADAIWAWRSTDGFTPPPPPFVGGSAVGQWRPTPPGLLPGAGPQFAYMTPWAIQSQDQFLPGGPPALESAQYATDFNETKLMGRDTSVARSEDQTLACRFWNASSASYYWNRVAVQLAAANDFSLSQNAHLLATLDIAMADAAIACWNAKYTYVFWRPVTAIPTLNDDGNTDTDTDPNWLPLLVTPNHPEYPSGHSTVSGAAAFVLVDAFGDATSFTLDSDVMLGVTRSFPSFTAALEEVKEARIFAGIHFRSACNDGQATGIQVADYILQNVLQRIRGKGSF